MRKQITNQNKQNVIRKLEKKKTIYKTKNVKSMISNNNKYSSQK